MTKPTPAPGPTADAVEIVAKLECLKRMASGPSGPEVVGAIEKMQAAVRQLTEQERIAESWMSSAIAERDSVVLRTERDALRERCERYEAIILNSDSVHGKMMSLLKLCPPAAAAALEGKLDLTQNPASR